MHESDPIRCIHCGKEIANATVHRELCPKQKPVNGIPLSHGLTPSDYMRLQAGELDSRG